MQKDCDQPNACCANGCPSDSRSHFVLTSFESKYKPPANLIWGIPRFYPFAQRPFALSLKLQLLLKTQGF